MPSPAEGEPDASLPESRPESLAPTAIQGLRPLSPDASELLDVAAVSGPSFSLSDVANVLCQAVGRLLAPLRELVGAGVIVPKDDAFAFADERVRDAVSSALPAPVRLALHRQIGGLLLARGDSAAAAAAHLLQGAHLGDRQALDALDLAVPELFTSAPSSAADLALRALDLTPSDDGGRFPRAVTAVDCLVAAERFDEATALARCALARTGAPSAVPAARLRLVVSMARLAEGRPSDALDEAEIVLDASGLPRELYAQAEVARIKALLAQSGASSARVPAQAILAGTNRGGDAALPGALMALAAAAWDDGRATEASAFLHAAVERGAAPGSPRLHPRLGLASMLTALGDLDEATALVAEEARSIERDADPAWAAASEIARSRVHLAAGDLDTARAGAEAGLTTAVVSQSWMVAPLARSVIVSVALLRDELDEAQRQVTEMRAEPPAPRSGFGAVSPRWIEARVTEARSGPAPAVEMLAAVYDDPRGARSALIDDPAGAAWLVRMALALDDRDRAARVVACAEQLAADNPGLQALAAGAVHARGVLDRDPVLLDRAALEHVHAFARASACEDAASVLARIGGRDAARARFERALDDYERMGATRDLARARSRLRGVGGQRRQSQRVQRPVSGWASLTDIERRVSNLAATGLTNREMAARMFLSRHTIDFHMRQIFRKLFIGSRGELIRLAAERDAEGGAGA